VVEKHHLHAGMLELIEEKHLVGIVPRQSIRRVYVHSIKRSQRRKITKTLERGTDQSPSTVAFIDEGEVSLQVKTIASHLLLERFELTRDGASCSEDTLA
jgi:hypothetical protein